MTTYRLQVEDREGGALYARMKLVVHDPAAIIASHRGSDLEVVLGAVRLSDAITQTDAALGVAGEWRTFVAVSAQRAGVISERTQQGQLTPELAARILSRVRVLNATSVTIHG